MNKHFLICLSIFAFSCKSKQLVEPPPVVVNEVILEIPEDNEHFIENESHLLFNITDEQGNKLVSVALQLILDEESCYNAYSDFDGFTQLNYDQSKITKDSSLEIIYKGFSKEMIPFAQLEKVKLQIIQLKRGDSIVSKEAYEKFYHAIRNCSNW